MPDLYTLLMPFHGRTYVYIMEETTGDLLISGYLDKMDYTEYDLCPVKTAEVYNNHITVYIEQPY